MSDQSSGEFQIERQPVYGRDETGAKLLGWTLPEIATMMAVVFLTALLFGSTKLTLGAGFATYVYLKKLKDQLPDRFFSNLFSYYTRDDHLYRAGGRDVEWRPPIVRHKN